MAENSQKFRYSEQLDNSSIRLIKIFPGGPSSPVKISLTTHKLQKSKYEALSYVWGTSLWKFPIICNKQTMEIGFNLHQALNERRRRGSSLLLWADAICINQGDLNERSQQVQIMDRIYQEASQVIVWLGNLDNHEDRISRFVQLASTLYRESGGPTFDIDRPTREQPRLNLKEGNAVEKLRGVKQTIIDVCVNQWFTRKWVVQELIMAKKAVMWINHEEVDADVVLWLTVRLFIQDAALRFQVLHPILFSAKILLAPFYFRYRGESGGRSTKKMSLGAVLGRLRGMDTTNPHDQIFAIAGIVPRFPRVLIDYTKQFEIMACEVGQYILAAASPAPSDVNRTDTATQLPLPLDFGYREIGREVDLEALESLSKTPNPQNHMLGLPTWVPDLFSNHLDSEARYGDHRLLSLSSIFPVGIHGALELFGLPNLHWEEKSGTQSPSVLSCHMIIKGKQFDHVRSVHSHSEIMSWAIIDDIYAAVTSGAWSRFELRKQFISICLDNLTYISQLRRSADLSLRAHDDIMSGDLFDSFWRTLVYDIGPNDGYPDPQIGFSFCYWYMLLKVLVTSHHQGLSFATLSYRVQVLVDLCKPFCAAASQCGSSRTFIVSNEGRLGWAPFRVHSADQIVTFAGMRVPSVLRKSEKGFEFLGCCFLLDMMDGEWNDPSQAWCRFNIV
ncbi:HET-domain-containing protein [Thozetella sp. PMI_491]|nr:HET-domain-containing protein [Thozetella sp. PMI_491]